MGMKTLKKEDLRDIFGLARLNIVNDSSENLSNQEFITKCYVKAVLTHLHITDVEFEERMVYSSVDED